MAPRVSADKVDFAADLWPMRRMLASIPFPAISPEIFTIRIGDLGFSLRWYALAYIVGIVIGWRLAIAAVSRERLWAGKPAMTREQVEELLIWIVLGVILGGRLGFALFYHPDYFLRNPLEIFRIWQGGMAFHGGLIGVAIAILGFSRRHGIPLGSLADILALATPPGLFLGRLANFANAELWGRPTALPWGVVFPGADAQDCPGSTSPCARHPSQLYEAGLEGLALAALLLFLVFCLSWLKRPWAVVGSFLTGYGATRIFVEFFRQADPQFISPGNPWGYVLRFGEAGLTMGQLLSLPMVLAGLAMLAVAFGRR